jgi:hypothetical protein
MSKISEYNDQVSVAHPSYSDIIMGYFRKAAANVKVSATILPNACVFIATE